MLYRNRAFAEADSRSRVLWRAFDRAVWRKPLALAADAALWELNRLSPVIDRIHSSYKNEAKVKKAI